MTNTRSIFVLILCLLSLGSFAAAQTPPSPSLTVTDQAAPHTQPTPHWSQFSTLCTVAPANAPQSTQETTISGPTYQWSCSNSTVFAVSQTNDSYTMLTSNPNTELTAGTNNVTVYCTMTYTSTDNKTGVATAIPVSGSTNPPVTFFATVPVQMQATFNINYKITGPSDWGHETHYDLKLLDNEAMPKPYTSGTVSEVFSGIQYNPRYASNLIAGKISPGTPSSGKSASQLTQDINFDDEQGWTNPPPGDTGDTTLWYQFAQTWHSQEMGHDKPLNAYNIYHQQGQALRR